MELPEPVADVRWRAGTADDADAIVEVAAAADRVDDPGEVGTRSDVVQLLAGVDPTSAVVMGERDGVPVAFALRFRPGGGPVRLLGAVAPAARGLGIGRALLRAQIADAGVAEPDAPALGLRSVGGRGAAPLARRSGFVEARVFLDMRRDLSLPVEPVPLPEGLRIVTFGTDLDEPLRVAKNEAFRDHWNALQDEPGEWRTRQLGPRLLRDRSAVAIDADGGIAGFVVVWRNEDEPGQAYVALVGTAREHRGRGVARALMAAVLQGAADAGFTVALLHVDGSSPTGADRLYRAVGFEEVSRATVWSRALTTAE